jgi:hypothetical protein
MCFRLGHSFGISLKNDQSLGVEKALLYRKIKVQGEPLLGVKRNLMHLLDEAKRLQCSACRNHINSYLMIRFTTSQTSPMRGAELEKYSPSNAFSLLTKRLRTYRM